MNAMKIMTNRLNAWFEDYTVKLNPCERIRLTV